MDDVTRGVFESAIEQLRAESRKSSYKDNPRAWCKDVLGIDLWSKQEDIFMSTITNDHVAVRSCHGSGKSFSAALLACWWVSTRPIGDTIVVSTAPTYHQVHAIIWENIRKFHALADERYKQGLSPMRMPGYITQSDQWKSESGVLMGFGRKPADNNDHGFQGIHRRYVLVLVDESCGIRPNLFEAVEAITTTQDSCILAVGNPDDPATQFNKFFQLTDLWHAIDIMAFDSPNFTKFHEGHYDECNEDFDDWTRAQCQKRQWAKRWDRDKALKLGPDVLAQLPNMEWVEQRRYAWGTESPLWLSKVLGEFPRQSVNTLFSAETLHRGIDKVIEPTTGTKVILGVDLARFGPNYSTVYSNIGGKIRLVDKWGGKADEQVDGMESAARVHQHAQSLGADEVRIDSEGVGGPILDQIVRLSEGSYAVIAMKGGRASPDIYRWFNSRAFWFDKMREDMFTGKIDIDPNDTVLYEELEGIQYHFKNRYKSLQIESKEDMEKRGVASPDHADAAVYAAADMSYVTDSPLGGYNVGDKISISASGYLGLEGLSWTISPL